MEFNGWKVIGNQREYYSRISFFSFSPYNFTYHSLSFHGAYRLQGESSQFSPTCPHQDALESPTGFLPLVTNI